MRSTKMWRVVCGAALGTAVVVIGLGTPARAETTIDPIQAPTAGQTPVAITGCDAGGLARVGTGWSHSVALDPNGKAYSWGSGSEGQLGDGATTQNRLTPAPVATDMTFTQVAGGQNFTVAVGTDGRAYTWGLNTWAQLGNGFDWNWTGPNPDPSKERQLSPATIAPIDQGGSEPTVVQVAAASSTGYALTADGKVYSWGSDDSVGALGVAFPAVSFAKSPVPRLVNGHGDLAADAVVTQVEGGTSNAFAIAGGGTEIYAWGDNQSGKLGTGVSGISRVPVKVDTAGKLATGVTFVDIAANNNTSYALDSTGQIWAWGLNYGGALGTGDPAGNSVPKPVEVIISAVPPEDGNKIVGISAMEYSVAAWDSNGTVYTWGSAASGQLGNGDASAPDQLTPQPIVDTILDGKKIVEVSVGANHTTAIDDAGQVYTWGSQDVGKLGDGVNADTVSAPVTPNLVDITQVWFDTAPATVDSAPDLGTINVTSPAHTAAVVDVTAQVATNAVATCGRFTFGTGPQVSTEPGDVRATAGSDITLTAAATGDEAPTVTWFQQAPGGNPQQLTAGFTTNSSTPGLTQTTLSLGAATAALDGHHFWAVFTNGLGEVSTRTAIVAVAAPEPTQTSTPTPPPTASASAPPATTPAATTGSLPLTGTHADSIGSFAAGVTALGLLLCGGATVARMRARAHS